VGYTKMMEDDEAATMAFLNFHNTLLRMEITGNGGRVIKTIGDAFLADFSSAVNAVRCAVSIQNRFLERNRSLHENRQLRIGIHIGDVVVSGNDIYGDGVNIASRLQAIAEPGGICVSEDVFHHIKNMIEFQAVFTGAKELKNVNRKVGVYNINPGGRGRSHSSQPKKRRGSRAFLFFIFLACLAAAGWYFAPLWGGQEWLSSAQNQVIQFLKGFGFAGAVPTPTAVPSPTPAPLAFTPTAVPTATPSVTPTFTPTATPQPPVHRPPVKKKAKIKAKPKHALTQKEGVEEVDEADTPVQKPNKEEAPTPPSLPPTPIPTTDTFAPPLDPGLPAPK
jgi:hypothetical protein